MAEEPFDKDMETYIKERKHSDDYDFIKPEPVEVPKEEQKPGFWSRLFGSKAPESVVEIKPVINEDMRAISKIALNVMKMLPRKELESYKEGDEFATFKDILKRNNLIK